jgi:chloramphenicol-sensitive protein RarD
MAPSIITAEERSRGLAYAAFAYFLWGLFPLYFRQIDVVPAGEILLNRIIWCVPAVAILIAIGARWATVRAVLADRKALIILLGTAIIIAANWWLYTWAVNAERVLEASLGYFINPIVSVLLGMVFLSERLSKLQVVAVVLAGLGVLNQVALVGHFPWVSLVLAATFATYGLLRKTVNADSRSGLFVETLIMLPVALLAYGVLFARGEQSLTTQGPLIMTLLIACGPVTALPLLFFAMGAKRLKLATLGLLQYIGPTLQFMTGLWFGEVFTPGHAVTFALIWCGLFVFSIDAIRANRRLPATLASGARPSLDRT